MWITRVSINNPVFATMVMVAITVLGLFSYARLRVEQMPDVTLPFLIIQTQYPGASPEAVEIDITRPIENAVNGVAGVKLVRSWTAEGNSSVFTEFRLDTDMMRAMQDVRDKDAQVRPSFPKDAKDPAQFGRIIVAQQGGGTVYLSQVADVIDGEKEETSLARINDRASITLDIQKSQDANIVETGRGVIAAVTELKKRIPKDVELTVVYNAAEQVEKSVNRVKSTILEGAGLTVLIVFLFLHSWRSTVITGLTL